MLRRTTIRESISTRPVRESRSDLETIRRTGFDGVITYECDGPLEQIAELAGQAGLKVIQGIWGPADRQELEKAMQLKNKVAAYCVGNEGLGTRYTIRELGQGLTYLSNQTGVPTAVSEAKSTSTLDTRN